MPFEIVLAPQAVEGLKALRADFRSSVRDAIELHLRHEPTKLSKSRIKRLRGLDRPQNRLRVKDRKSTRLNSSHGYISYAVFCLKKKNTTGVTCFRRQ